jgi:hypothetical protein
VTQAATSQPAILGADNAQRMLLMCVLHDAIELHYAAMDRCPACAATKAADPAANECWDCWTPHREPITRYGDLAAPLVALQDAREGTAYPLTVQDRELLAAALPEAITYRQERDGATDRALLAAYRELALA